MSKNVNDVPIAGVFDDLVEDVNLAKLFAQILDVDGALVVQQRFP